MDIQKNDNNNSNTLDLNKSNPSTQSGVSSVHSSRVAPVKPPSKKKKWVLLSLGAIMLIAVIGFFSYRYYQQRLTEDNLKNSKIVIGDTTITQEDISKYANALDENKKENPGVYYDSGSREIAINDLVTNAGLKDEAKQQDLSLTTEEYQKLFELPVGITDATPYLNQIKSFNDFSYVAVTQKENEALKAKLKDKIISSKKFLVSQITFDAPFFTEQKDPKVANNLHAEAKAKLNNDFLPLFKSKAKPEAMGAISDVNQVDPTKPDTNNAEQYFTKMVTTSLFIDEYYGQEGFFNDVETDQYGVVKVEDLKYTPPEFDRLKNVGEYTEMFASRTGNYMIVRLEEKAERQYDTWDQFTKSYVDKYVPKKMLTIQQASKIISDLLYKTKDKLELNHLGATEALAAVDCSSNHFVTINLNAKVYRQDGIFQGYLNVPYSWSSTGQCPTRSGTGTTPGSFRINCYNGRPTITVTQQPDPSRFRVRGFGIEGNGDWNYANVNAFVGSSVDWFLTYELVPQNPQYTVTSTLSRSTGGGFGNSVVPDGTHGICQVNTVYCAWGAGDSVSLGGLTAAANVSAPATITYYPWFQTQKGDVTSLDIIQGQKPGPGANQSFNPANAYGVVAYGDGSASATIRSGYFCSQNLYILGEDLSNRERCSSAYLFGPEGSISWGRYVSSPVSFATTRASVDSAWQDNGAGSGLSCNPYNTVLLNSNGDPVVLRSDISGGCAGGSIMKAGNKANNTTTNLTSPSSDPSLRITGRATLWIQGNLNINSDIVYSDAITSINNLPNLAIFVEGKITIDPSVTRIDAMLISSGKIDTCKDSGDKSANKCEKQLTINGAISSLGSKIDLSRRYYKADSPNANPAELVILTPQSIIMPPPGLSIVGVESGGDLQINKIELPPRI